MEFSEIFVLGKLLIVSEDRETFSVKLPIMNAYRGCSFRKKKIVQNIKFWLSVSFRSPKRSQFGHERFIFKAQRGRGEAEQDSGIR